MSKDKEMVIKEIKAMGLNVKNVKEYYPVRDIIFKSILGKNR